MNTNEVTWTSEDVQLVEKFIEIRNRGFYCDGGQLTSAYNRILHKNVGVTNCGSCIRARINELEGALNQFKRLSEKASEAQTKQEVDNVPQEENKAVRKARKSKK